MKSSPLLRVPVSALEITDIVWILGFALNFIDELKLLANLLVRTIFEAVVFLAGELQFERGRVTQAAVHRSRRIKPGLLTFMHPTPV